LYAKKREVLLLVKKTVSKQIGRTIKELWKRNIRNDYMTHHLLKEDTLKNSFYFHLRRKLGTSFLEENAIRIYTEFNDSELKGTGFRADIVIAELGKDYDGYLGSNIKSIIAIVEFKYGGMYTPDSIFYDDINKVKNYIRECKIDCLYYLGFIIEKEYPSPHWLDGRQTSNWANKKVAVLSANKEINGNGTMQFFIQSCNGMNVDLD